jgi:hypothetical protein
MKSVSVGEATTGMAKYKINDEKLL